MPEPVDRTAADAAAVAAGDRVSINGEPPANPGTGAVRPENIPEKFWDAATGTVRTDALLSAYQTLESARGTPPADPESPPAGTEPPAVDPESPPAEANAVVRAQEEWNANGALSEETYAALEKDAGIDRATIDTYIQGVQAMQQLAFVAAGGEEQYGQMVEWAKTHLTPAEIEAYDEAVGSNNAKELATAVQGLASRYRQGARNEPPLLSGQGAVPLPEGFKSRSEMTAAMSDPKYRVDPNFRAEVAAKIAAASKAGVQLFV